MEQLRKLRSETSRDQRPTGEVPTLRSAIATWLADQKRRIRTKSYTTYELVLRLHVLEAAPALVAMRVDRIRPAHIRELFAALDATRSPRVRELVFLRLHAIFASLIGESVIKNPVLASFRPRVPRKTMNAWTQEQAKKFLDVTSDDRLAPLYRLALSVGMRKGELLGLRWLDVDIKAKRVHIQHTLSDDGKTLGEAKTAGSRRTIELPAKAAAALAAQKKALLAGGLRASPWVFPDEDGGPLLARKLSRAFASALLKANVPAIRFHDLRHTAASLRLQMGEHPKIVSEMLGHSKVSITMDLYQHTMPSMQRDSADRFDAIL
jgi:integrase